jgi:hypothetical protein
MLLATDSHSLSLWAILFQTIGGAVILPLYIMAHTYITSKTLTSSADQSIPPSQSRSLLPAAALGLLLPTAMMFYPFSNIDHTMLATAFWQPSPIYVNILWIIFATFTSGQGSAKQSIRTAYILSGLISLVSHQTTVFLCLISPELSLSAIFLPQQRANMSFDSAIHFFFQIDYLIIFISTTIWAFQNIMDVKRVTGGGTTGGVSTVLGLVVGAIAIGPAATLSAVWYWREERISGVGKGRKIQ